MKEFEEVVLKINPAATLLRAWELKGGISAQMTALEIQSAGGERGKVIVRRPGEWALQQNPNAAAEEYRILQFVRRAGIKAQTPYLLDTSGEIFPEPYLVIEYIEGEPDYTPADVAHCVVQMAEELAKLHTALPATGSGDAFDLTSLPQQMPRLTQKLIRRPAVLDDSLDEGRIRNALERVWPLPVPDQPALVHGDFWPGNLLWQEGTLVAIIDWEDAEAGDPLADFATTRLDILWLFGMKAMNTFTQHYQTLTRFDFATLPYWDLIAALRPAGRLDLWAEAWPALGRSDITEATMRTRHRTFVEQAFEQIMSR